MTSTCTHPMEESTTTTTPSVKFIETKNWAILPTQHATCKDLCFTILNPKTITIYPNKANEIDLGFYAEIDPKYLLQVGYHNNPNKFDFDWRIITSYLRPEAAKESVSLLILTTKELQLIRGEKLGYVHVQPVSEALTNIIGKSYLQVI